MENERLCFSVLSEYTRLLRDWKVSSIPTMGTKRNGNISRPPKQKRVASSARTSIPKATATASRISERWNGKEQLVAWRAAWADVANRYKELPMEKIISIDELNRAVMEGREDVVIDLCKVLDHESYFDPIFDPPESF